MKRSRRVHLPDRSAAGSTFTDKSSLDDPSIEPTNNRAERALRGAVIARKVSHCSKNVGGADAFSAFTSVIRTLARNGGDHSPVNGLCGVFSGATVPTPSF